MGSVPFHYLDLRTFSYATEDDQRVERALQTLLPEDYPIERQESEGHHGDRIIVFSTRVDNADDIRHVVNAMNEGGVFSAIADELDQRVTDNTELFVQLDKQAAYNGKVTVGEGITVRGKIEAYPADRERALDNIVSAVDQLTG